MTTGVQEEPTHDTTPAPVGAWWMTTLALAVIGIAVGWFGPLQILLPAQASDLELDGAGSKESVLAVVTGTGAAVSLLANPLWGLISDRIRSPWGQRLPVIVTGLAIGVAGLLVLAWAPTIGWMVTGWALVQFGLNGPAAAYAAVIADQVPPAQHGVVGALFGIAQTAGVVVGTAVAVLSGEGRWGYLSVAIAVCALTAAWLLTYARPDSTGHERPRPRAAQRRRPRPQPEYLWAWTIRFLMNFVNAVMLLYLYFYLDDEVGVEEPENAVLLITVLVVAVAAVTAGAAGFLSDRLGRRRSFAATGGAVAAIGTGVLACTPTLPVVVAATAIVGLGWGLYLAVDVAIVTGTLTDPGTNATMLGLANIANTLPQVLAPFVAAPLVASAAGYAGLYGSAAVAGCAAALCTTRLHRTA
ncbi:MFS transporter [Nocardia takedensis]|uniref:MFS transporter n=1 Tax=Nocardia takedensis TaxID=259390 RepID=UPI0002DF7E0D|nr:MFS transporter [Nocardia takedensis]